MLCTPNLYANGTKLGVVKIKAQSDFCLEVTLTSCPLVVLVWFLKSIITRILVSNGYIFSAGIT